MSVAFSDKKQISRRSTETLKLIDYKQNFASIQYQITYLKSRPVYFIHTDYSHERPLYLIFYRKGFPILTVALNSLSTQIIFAHAIESRPCQNGPVRFINSMLLDSCTPAEWPLQPGAQQMVAESTPKIQHARETTSHAHGHVLARLCRLYLNPFNHFSYIWGRVKFLSRQDWACFSRARWFSLTTDEQQLPSFREAQCSTKHHTVYLSHLFMVFIIM